MIYKKNDDDTYTIRGVTYGAVVGDEEDGNLGCGSCAFYGGWDRCYKCEDIEELRDDCSKLMVKYSDSAKYISWVKIPEKKKAPKQSKLEIEILDMIF